MADEFDDFDDLAVDDAFLAAVDQIEKQAVSSTSSNQSTTSKASSLQSKLAQHPQQSFMKPPQTNQNFNTLDSDFSNSSVFPTMSHNPPTSRTKSIPKLTNNKKKNPTTTSNTGHQKTLWNMFAIDKENTETFAKPNKKPHKTTSDSNSVMKFSTNSSLDSSCYDPETVNTWIYPINYPLRDYQFNIVSKALFQNTLVSLPTGLGKTFIAAVVMYNHYRWFPKAKIVFMAPTKPLVAQQIEACHNICGIPQEDTVELTGAQSPEKRKIDWIQKRVFFLTPQVLQNDLIRGTCPAERIVCLIVDEAHRARGEHANCVVVRELYARNPLFRILALSATPGTDIATVQDVVNNLKISNIELRSEESIDIQKYTHGRKIDVIVVPLTSTINEISKQFCSCMEPYTSRLCRMQVIWEKDPQKVSRYMLILARNKFRSSSGALPPEQKATVEGDFGICLALSHAYSLLYQHGVRPFYSALYGIVQEAKDGKKISRARQDLLKNSVFVDLMNRIEKMLKEPTFIGHPKLEKLVSYTVNYFVNHQADNDELESHAQRQTRVMIFAEYRESVDEIVKALDIHSPMIRPMSFVGQASKKTKKGYTQKEQLAVLTEFKQGGYNVIVSTCIGEEGLDIGEVDLIICYDSHNSPIRLLQRMGRTGRKRQGRICMLLTEGKEEQMYKQSQNTYKSIQRAIASGSKITLYNGNPKLLPQDVNPVCIKETLVIPEYQIRDTKKSRRKTAEQNLHLVKDEDEEIEGQYIRFLSRTDGSNVSLSRFAKYQTTLTSTYLVSHSRRTIDFVNIMSEMETLGFIKDEDQYGMQLQEYLNMNDVIPFKSSYPPPKRPKSLKKNSTTNQLVSNRAQLSSNDEKLPLLTDLEDDADDFMIMQGIDGIFEENNFTKPSTSRDSDVILNQSSIKAVVCQNPSPVVPIEIDLEDIEYKEPAIIPQSPEFISATNSREDTTFDVPESDDDMFIDDTMEQEMVALVDSHQLQQNLGNSNLDFTHNQSNKQDLRTSGFSAESNTAESRTSSNLSASTFQLRSKYQYTQQNVDESTTDENEYSSDEMSDISKDISLGLGDSLSIKASHITKASKLTEKQSINHNLGSSRKSITEEIPPFPKNVKFGNWREVAKILSSRKSVRDPTIEKPEVVNSPKGVLPTPNSKVTSLGSASAKLSTSSVQLSSKSKLDQFRFKRRKS